MPRTASVLFAIVLFLPTHVHAQFPSRQLTDAVDKAVMSEMKRQELVGVAVGVLRKGKIVYVKGYGLADREQRLPVTIKTRFNWASNSKPVLALLIMLLFGQGMLDLDADVRRYVPEFPKSKEIITPRHLLCHQSGIPHYGPDAREVRRRYKKHLPFKNPVIALNKFARLRMQFAPGEKFQYSSYAYVLLSAVAQRAGRKRLNAQIRERITRPLGMDSFQLDYPARGRKHQAVGYVKDKKGKIVYAPEYAHYWKHGAGAYKSNIVDFAKWAQALINRKLVSKKIEDIMWQSQTTNDGKLTRFGLGFGVNQKNGHLQISHNGKQSETTTRMVLYPQQKHGVVVMCNCDFAAINRIADAIYKVLPIKKENQKE